MKGRRQLIESVVVRWACIVERQTRNYTAPSASTHTAKTGEPCSNQQVRQGSTQTHNNLAGSSTRSEMSQILEKYEITRYLKLVYKYLKNNKLSDQKSNTPNDGGTSTTSSNRFFYKRPRLVTGTMKDSRPRRACGSEFVSDQLTPLCFRAGFVCCLGPDGQGWPGRNNAARAPRATPRPCLRRAGR